MGRTTAWISTRLDLVAGEAAGPLVRTPRSSAPPTSAADGTASGIVVRAEPTAWMFPTVDLTISPHRGPVGDRTGLDPTVVFGPTGQGVTSTVRTTSTAPSAGPGGSSPSGPHEA